MQITLQRLGARLWKCYLYKHLWNTYINTYGTLYINTYGSVTYINKGTDPRHT